MLQQQSLCAKVRQPGGNADENILTLYTSSLFSRARGKGSFPEARRIRIRCSHSLLQLFGFPISRSTCGTHRNSSKNSKRRSVDTAKRSTRKPPTSTTTRSGIRAALLWRCSYEELARAPLLVRGLGMPAGSMRPEIAANIDLPATFAEIVGFYPGATTGAP